MSESWHALLAASECCAPERDRAHRITVSVSDVVSVSKRQLPIMWRQVSELLAGSMAIPRNVGISEKKMIA